MTYVVLHLSFWVSTHLIKRACRQRIGERQLEYFLMRNLSGSFPREWFKPEFLVWRVLIIVKVIWINLTFWSFEPDSNIPGDQQWRRQAEARRRPNSSKSSKQSPGRWEFLARPAFRFPLLMIPDWRNSKQDTNQAQWIGWVDLSETQWLSSQFYILQSYIPYICYICICLTWHAYISFKSMVAQNWFKKLLRKWIK